MSQKENYVADKDVPATFFIASILIYALSDAQAPERQCTPGAAGFRIS